MSHLGKKDGEIRNPYQMPWASSRMKGTTLSGSRYIYWMKSSIR